MGIQRVSQAELERMDQVSSMPPILLRQAIGPYVLGVHFMTRGNVMAAALGGYPGADAKRAFDDGPLPSDDLLDVGDQPFEVLGEGRSGRWRFRCGGRHGGSA